MSRERPYIPNRDDEFNQLAEQLATPTELDLASQHYDRARNAFFDRLEAYTLRTLGGQSGQSDILAVSGFDYRILMNRPTAEMVLAFKVDAVDDGDLIDTLTKFFVNESRVLAGDLNALAGQRLAALEHGIDDFRDEYLKSYLDQADNSSPDDRLSAAIVRLHSRAVDDFVDRLTSGNAD